MNNNEVVSKELIEVLCINADAHPLDVDQPVMTNAADALESQAREIASKQATIDGMNEAHWKVVQELAAPKAQQSGVVLTALLAALESVVHDNRVPNEVSQECAAVLIELARLNSSPVSSAPSHSERVMVPQMVDFSPVPDDFRSQANGYRAGWNDCRAAIAAAPSAGSQKEQG